MPESGTQKTAKRGKRNYSRRNLKPKDNNMTGDEKARATFSEGGKVAVISESRVEKSVAFPPLKKKRNNKKKDATESSPEKNVAFQKADNIQKNTNISTKNTDNNEKSGENAAINVENSSFSGNRKKRRKSPSKKIKTNTESSVQLDREIKMQQNNLNSEKINQDAAIDRTIAETENVGLQSKKQPRKEGKKKQKPVRIVFLGGVGEIGKNMTAIEYANDIIIIDAGISFPDESMHGIDLVVPDISYLVERKDKIKGIFLTHGHEDHIGGLPYLLKEINIPVYGTKLTLAIADNKVREHKLNNLEFNTVKPGETVKAGCFSVRFVNVNHSIAGSVAFAIDTPHGLIYHSGDYKIDLTPVAGSPVDLREIGEIGSKGVLLYLGESTNAERAGYTMSETVVGTTLDHLFGEYSRSRLIIATFASNVHRLQQIIDLAYKYRRKVALNGRSMLNVVDAAIKIGELTIPEGVLIDIEKIKNYSDNELVIVSTGSQGEPMSALSKMSLKESKAVVIGKNDTVIISANPIPGNEKFVYRVINNLYKLGANVVYETLEKIHVSGHACAEEHKIMHSLLRPKFFVPVHGEYRHLIRHAQLAKEVGLKDENILIPDIGTCVEVTSDTIRYGESVPAGARLIDGDGIEDEKTSVVMRERRILSEEGEYIIHAVMSDGIVVSDVQVISRGVISGDGQTVDAIIRMANKVIASYKGSNPDELAGAIRKAVRNMLLKKSRTAPMIVPIISEV